ncbi:MAG: NAD(P)H-dependent oxidoreductase subunit E [Dethiobacter sp.]|jgi:NADH-quinone oxidoreductase E subunit|nr:MAG: NAD(P)H-dependent oxidoreductase subunit E [Dethiobacter sp.]
MEKTAVEKKENYQELDSVLEKYKGRAGVLIKALQEAQEIYGYLPRELLIHIAYELDVPLSEVYSVVSFYSLFKTQTSGRCHLEICSGTACYVKGMKNLLEYLEEDLSLKPGGVTEDGKFSVSTTNCVGACSAAPVVKIGDELYGEMTLERLQQLLEEHDHE